MSAIEGSAGHDAAIEARGAEAGVAARYSAAPQTADPDTVAQPSIADAGVAKERAEAREAALVGIIQRHPEAVVAAFARDSLFCPMPQSLAEGLGIGPARGTVGRAPLDMVSTEDHLLVLSKWRTLMSEGHAEFRARMVRWGTWAQVVAVDLFERHGVAVLVAWPEASSIDVDSTYGPRTSEGRTPPRIGRVVKDSMAKLIEVDEAIGAMFGWSSEQMNGRMSIEYLHPDDHSLAVDAWLEMLSEPGPGRRVRLRHACADGSWKWVEIVNHNLLSEPAHRHVLTDVVDISDEMAAWEAVREREKLLNELAQALPVGIARLSSDGQVVYANTRLCELAGRSLGDLPSADALVSLTVERDRRALRRTLEEALRRGVERTVLVHFSRATGPGVICEARAQPLRNSQGDLAGAIACFTDVTEAVTLRQALEQRAETDELTGCANRRSVMAFLERVVAAPHAHEHSVAAVRGVAVIFVDLDGFKCVNDSLGHAAGDEVLVEVAARLKRVVRACDRVGRVGGDEFLVVCPAISTMRQASRVVARLVNAFTGTVSACGRPLDVRASMGLAWASHRPVDADELVRVADAAMYRSKAGGGGPVAVEVGPDNDARGELARGGGTPLVVATGLRQVANRPRSVSL